MHDPGIVLADEPTGSLDATAGAVVMDLLEELVRERGHTMLLVTHSNRLAARADRTVQLRGGGLSEAPPVDA